MFLWVQTITRHFNKRTLYKKWENSVNRTVQKQIHKPASSSLLLLVLPLLVVHSFVGNLEVLGE